MMTENEQTASNAAGTNARSGDATTTGHPPDRAIRATPSNAPGRRRPTLIQTTMRQLLRDIIMGVYGPGDRIAETDLAERYGVSRAPVREALRVLEKDGLVALTPWRGARVIDPDPVEISAVFDLLATVYGTVARLAVENADDETLARFSEDVEKFSRWQDDDRDVFDLLDLAYRSGTRLGENCGSPLVSDTLRSLGRAAYWLHRHLRHAPAAWRRQSVTKLRKLEAALHERSSHKSETAARKVVQHTQRLVMKHVR